MNGREFLPVAQRLKDSTFEAERRTSIGRSYYAVFHAVKTVLTERGVVLREIPEDHRTIISYLTKSGNRTAGSLGNALKDLRGDRNRADYDLKVAVTAGQSNFAYQKAERSLRALDGIAQPDLDKIIDAIQRLP